MIKLFEKTATSFETNGIGLLTNYIFDPKVKEERNGYFAFTFKIPLHTKYGVQIAGEMIVTADCPGVGEQPFRIQKVIPSMGILSVEANHIFYDLADNFIEDINIVGANGQRAGQHILDNTVFPHNFTFRSDLANNYNCRIVRYNPVEAFLDDSKDNTFVSRWGGEIKRDKYEIVMNNMRGTDRGVRISNRKNLTGYEATIDYEPVVTRIVPQGYDGLMLPEMYVDSPLIEQYTHPKIAVVQYPQIKAQTESEPKEDELPLEEAYEELRRLASEEFSEHHVDEPKATYKINFIDLRKTTEYKDFEHLEEILPWDWVTVDHDEDNLHVKARLQSYTWDPLMGMYVELILGSVKSTVSGSMGKDVDYQDQIDQIREISNAAMKSADGKNTIFIGLYGEGGTGEPTATKIGDLWFKPEDDETVTKQWDGNAWITINSTAPDPELVEAIEEVGKEVEQAQSDSATALENANSAVNKANEASAKADQSQQTANQAKSDATNAVNNANQAKDDAQDALDKAGQADATANQAESDATTAVNTANEAKSSAGTALTNANQAIADATDALNQSALAKSQAEEAINKYLGMGMVPAWSWSPDGTDRFTTVEPGENLYDTSLSLNNSATTIFEPWTNGTSTVEKANGVMHIIVADDKNQTGYSIHYKGPELKKNTKYSFGVDAKGTGNIRIAYRIKNTAGEWAVSWTGMLNMATLTADYSRYSGSFVTPDWEMQDIQISFYPQGGGSESWQTKPKLEISTAPTIYTPSPFEDYSNAAPSYIGFAIEPSDNPSDYTWIRNPEKVEGEVKVELTEINGELSRKVSQENFDQLNGTVINNSTLISQNQNDIKLKADQSTVDTINQTVADHSTAIDLNSKAIDLKANQSTVDSLTGRVTEAEGSITTIAGQVALKANKTDVDTIAGRVTSAESQLTVQAGRITGLSTLTDGHTTQIGSLQSGYDGLSSTVSKVESDLNGLEVGGRNYVLESEICPGKLANAVWEDSYRKLSSNITGQSGEFEIGFDLTYPSDATSSASIDITLQTKGTGIATFNVFPYRTISMSPGQTVHLTNKFSFDYSTLTAGGRITAKFGGASDILLRLEKLYIKKSTVTTDWSPAPEDLATASEMSSLTQTVDSISATVTANKTEADGKFSSQQTAINANTNSIKLKANQSTVDTLTGRVSTAEGSIDVLSGQVALKANQSTVDTLTNTVNAHSSELTVQAGKITGLTSVTDGHTSKIGALELQAGQFSLSLSDVQSDLDGLEIGGRNYVLESESCPEKLANGAWEDSYRKLSPAIAGLSGEFEIGFDITYPSDATSDASIDITLQTKGTGITTYNVFPYRKFTISPGQTLHLTNKYTFDYSALTAGGRITAKFGGAVDTLLRLEKLYIKKGNKTTDWSPAPEDMATVTALTEVKATVDSLTMTVADKADKTTVTQLANQWQQTTDLANGHTSQISSLGDAINFRITNSDGSITQIDLANKVITLSGEQVNITGTTYIEAGVIKTAHIADAAITSAKIGSLSADKITAGTLNGGNVNIINLNADNIVSGTISGQNLSINLTSGEVMFTKGSIRNADATFVMDIVTGVVSSRGTVLSPNSTGDLLPTGFDLMNGKLQFMNGSYGETSVVYGGIDTNTHYGQVLNSSSSWISGNYFSNAPTLVVNSGDQTNSVWQSWKKNVALGTTDFKELPMLSSGVKAGLGLTGSKKAYDQNIIGGSMGIVSNATSSVCPDGFAQTKAVIQARNGIYMSSGFHYQVSGNSVSILTPASIRIGDTTNDNGSADAQKQSAASIFAQGHTFTFKGDTADLWANHHKLRGLYSATKSASANIYLDTDGSLYRATSARKYKTAITIADDVIQHAKKVLSIQPSSWFDKSELGQPTLERRYGFIADEFHEAGLREVVVYNKNEIESLAYDRIPMYHNVILNEHEQRIQDLENEVQKLKMEIEGLKAA